jgi:AhpD family alkylhydroperoxidase
MARLDRISSKDYVEELKAFIGVQALGVQDTHGVMGIWAQRPDLALPYRRFAKEVVQRAALPRRLIELVRLRIAFHNQCRSCMSIRYQAAVEEGVTEDLVCELAVPEEADNLTEAEKAALRYADLMATNHLAINDDLFDSLKQHFTEPDIVELGLHVAMFIGFGRLAMSWDAVDTLPDRFRQREDSVTPWGGDARIIPDRFARSETSVDDAEPAVETQSMLIVEATVPKADREKFDEWYGGDHMPKGLEALGARKAWRFWDVERPDVHCAAYQMSTARLEHWRRQHVGALRTEFDETWPMVSRRYLVLRCVDCRDGTLREEAKPNSPEASKADSSGAGRTVT